MPDDDSFRRYLITVGITTGLTSSGPRIVDSVNRMTRVFTSAFGYKRVTELDIDPASDQIRKSIREFCLKCHPGDIVTLYYTGHANEVNETHRVWTGDPDPVSGTLETRHLAELMLVGTPLRYALIILDTCFAGRGGAEALRGSMPSIDEGDGKTLALLTAAYPREQIVAGDFARLFERAVAQPGLAGCGPRYIDLGAIARVIDADPERPGWQTVAHNLLGGRTNLLPYLPNRRFNPELDQLDLLTQLRIEQQELRIEDLRSHFEPRARGVLPREPGVDAPAESGWRFVGREAVLRDLVAWLEDGDARSSRIVTGGPGSGKSAVIGRLVMLSDHDQRPTVPVEDLAPDTIPPEGSLVTAVLARGRPAAEVLTAVCAAAGVRADTPADLLRQMGGQRLTVAIDAIDEALDPPGLVNGVLRPLVEAGPAQGLRLLLGTRPHLLSSLGPAGSVLDLDDETYADPASLYEYVIRGLETDNPRSPYYSAPGNLVTEVARAVAAAAGHSFLVALIESRSLLSAPLPDPADPAWRASLPGNAADAMHKDLQTRLGQDADRARDLLRPLAFAQGAGLPWEDLWAPLSSRLSGHDYTNEDLIWLRRQAGSYVVEAMESGRSVYRLYHAAMAEYLRQGCDEDHVHRLFTSFLTERVPASRPGLDWTRAHPYALAHLATHAQRAGRLDGLLLDPGYLVNAVPAGLLATLPAARDPDAELAGRAYQRAVHQLRNEPEDDRLSYLQLAAHISHASQLADRIAARAPHRRWAVTWTHWPPEHPHRILDAYLGQVNAVAFVHPGDGNPVAVSIGQDAKLRIWDAVTAEPRGTYIMGAGPLTVVRAVRLPDQRTVLVLLSADGMLHIWDMSTAALIRTVPVAPLWRRLTWLRNAELALRCLTTPDGRPVAVSGGRGIRTAVWDLSSGRQMTLLPAGATPASVEFAELMTGRPVIVVPVGRDEQRFYELDEGRALPDERRLGRSTRMRSAYEVLIRGSFMVYYALRDGPPVVAVRFSRRTAMVWDLSAEDPLGIWPRGDAGAQVRLTDGRMVTVPFPPPGSRSWTASQPGQPPMPSGPGPDAVVLVPFSAPDRGPSALEAGGPRFDQSGRFLHVHVDDHPGTPERGDISLTLAGHTADVTGYDWTRLADGHVIVITGSRDGTVRRWDISSIRPGPDEGTEQARVTLHRIVAVPLDDGTPVGLTIADGDDVAMWDLRTGELIGNLAGREARPCAIGVSRPRGRPPIAVTFDADRAMRTWSLPDGRLEAGSSADAMRWPGDAACTQLPDGTCVAVTSGHGRRSVVWDLATGGIRNVLAGHRGWSACVTTTSGSRLRPLALTGGFDNRVNVWDVRRGRRRNRFRIVPAWTFAAHPVAGRAYAVRTVDLDGGKFLALVATCDGMIRAFKPRAFRGGARRLGAMPGNAVGAMRLSNGRPVVVVATNDGVVRVWKPDAFTRKADDDALLCQINLEVPANDIHVAGNDTFVMATPTGLTAVQLDAPLLENGRLGAARRHASGPAGSTIGDRDAADYARR